MGNQSTPLHLACEFGNEEVMHQLVAHRADIESRDHHGCTPLHVACMSGYLDCVMFLILQGADVNVRNRTGLTPLHLAFLNGHLHVAQFLLNDWNRPIEDSDEDMDYEHEDEGSDELEYEVREEIPQYQVIPTKVDASLCDAHQRNALHAAAQLGDLSLCDDLCRRGAQIDQKDREGRIALHYCAQQASEKWVDWFQENDVDLDTTDNFGRTSLHYACFFGNFPFVQRLLFHDANTNISDYEGESPLLCLLRDSGVKHKHRAEIVALLLDNDADTLHANIRGRNAFHLSCTLLRGAQISSLLLESNTEETEAPFNACDVRGLTPLHFAAAFGKHDLVVEFLQHGADPNVQDLAGCTPLHWACRTNSVECSFLLLQRGVSPLLPDRAGKTAFHYACSQGFLPIVQLFTRESTIDINVTCSLGRTGLHRAAAFGHSQIVQHLISLGAQLEVGDRNGVTPLMLAGYFGFTQVVSLLLSAGALPMATDHCQRTYLYYTTKGERKRRKTRPAKAFSAPGSPPILPFPYLPDPISGLGSLVTTPESYSSYYVSNSISI